MIRVNTAAPLLAPSPARTPITTQTSLSSELKVKTKIQSGGGQTIERFMEERITREHWNEYLRWREAEKLREARERLGMMAIFEHLTELPSVPGNPFYHEESET